MPTRCDVAILRPACFFLVEGQWQCWMQRAARGWRTQSDHKFIEPKGRGLSVAKPSARVASVSLSTTAPLPLFVVAVHASSCRPRPMAVGVTKNIRSYPLSCPVLSCLLPVLSFPTPTLKGNQPASRMKPPPPLCFIPSHGRFAPQQQQHGTACPLFW